MSFDFGEVLARAWGITWKHKVLWLGGIILTLFSFVAGLLPNLALNPFFSPGGMEGLERIEQQPWLFVWFIGFVFLLMIISIPVSVVGLTIPVAGAIRHERQADMGFGSLLRESLRYFWRVLGLFLLVGAIIFVVAMAFMLLVMLVNLATFGIGMLCVMPLYCVLIPAMLLVYAYITQGQVAILADDLGVIDALKRSWELIRENFLGILLLSIAIYFGLWLINMIISIPFMIPMYAGMFRMMESVSSQGAVQMNWMRTTIIWMLIYAPVASLVQGISLTFIQTTWTVTYLRLTRKSGLPEAPALVETNP